jgi:hypothetical protein
VQTPEFDTPHSIPLGGGAAIMGGELSVTNAVWCRMFARADITPTAIGPDSRGQIVLANPAPLDIDEPRGPIPNNAADAKRARFVDTKKPGRSEAVVLGTADLTAGGPLRQAMSTRQYVSTRRARWRPRRFRRHVSRFILGGGKMMHLRVAA